MANIGMGSILTSLRNERQLTMDMLVEDINYKYDMKINKSMVSRWERNENDPSLEMAVILAKYYNVSLDYLIGLTDVKTPARLLASASKRQSEESAPTLKLNHDRPLVAIERPTQRLRSLSKGMNDTMNDDDFEYDFLNMDDDKKGRK